MLHLLLAHSLFIRANMIALLARFVNIRAIKWRDNQVSRHKSRRIKTILGFGQCVQPQRFTLTALAMTDIAYGVLSRHHRHPRSRFRSGKRNGRIQRLTRTRACCATSREGVRL